jgi:hypothetical protein
MAKNQFISLCSGFFSKAADYTGEKVAPRVESLAAGTALAAAATSPLNLLNAAMQGFNTTSSTMTNLIGIAAQALPITGLVEGAIRAARGMINMGLDLKFYLLSNKEEAFKKRFENGFLSTFASNLFEAAQGSVLLYYGKLAFQAGSSATMFYGFFIARAISLLTDIVSLLKDGNKLESSQLDSFQRQLFEKKCLDVLFKAIEVTGWALLMSGAPIGGIFLAAALMYQAYKAMAPKPLTANEGQQAYQVSQRLLQQSDDEQLLEGIQDSDNKGLRVQPNTPSRQQTR